MTNVVDIRTRRHAKGERYPHGRIHHACADCARKAADAELEQHIETMREALVLARSIERLLDDAAGGSVPSETNRQAATLAAASMRGRAHSLGMGGLLDIAVAEDDGTEEKR